MSGSETTASEVNDDTDVEKDDEDEDEDSDRNSCDVADLALRQAVSPTEVRVENSSNVHIGSRFNYNAPVTINQYVNVQKTNENVEEGLQNHAIKAPVYVGGFTKEQGEVISLQLAECTVTHRGKHVTPANPGMLQPIKERSEEKDIQPIGKDVSAHWLVSCRRHLLVWGCLGLVSILVIIIVVTVTTTLLPMTSSHTNDRYTVPDALVEPLYPRGLRVSIPDSSDLELFAFHGNINKAVTFPDAGTLSKNITSPRNGRWVFENTNVELKKGDTIYFWTYVMLKDGQSSRRENQTFVVEDFVTEPTTDLPVTTTIIPVVPDALVEPLYPRGLRVSIPDFPGMKLFAFHGNINQPFYSPDAGTMSKDVIMPRNGRWIFEDTNVELKKGDIIYFWTSVTLKDGRGYRRDNQKFIIMDFVTEPTTDLSVSTTITPVVPDALVEPLYPRGLRVSIPDFPGMKLFAFHGNINQPFYSPDAGTMSKDVIMPRNGRWIFENTNVELKKGDIIYFWTSVTLKDGRGYRRDNQQFIVMDFITESTTEVPVTPASPYNVPEALVEPLYPRGLRVSIPDPKDITQFAFHGNVNKRLALLEAGTLSKDINAPTNGRWVFKDINVELKKGDIIYYWTYVIHKNGQGYRKDNQQFVVQGYSDLRPGGDLKPTVTKYHCSKRKF